MDIQIYTEVCRVQGHNITGFVEKLLDPKNNNVLEVTKLLCTRCGGENAELQVRPKPARRTKKDKQENPPEAGAQ
jgi:hypothetical protein